MDIVRLTKEEARYFIDRWHPLMTRGALRGLHSAWGGVDGERLSFVALLTYPRSRWSRTRVDLELSRLAISPFAQRSAVTFLRKLARVWRRCLGDVVIVTYAMPGASGAVYEQAGWIPYGHSSGSRRSRRGPRSRPTPDTVGSGVKLPRFLLVLKQHPS